MSAPFWRLSLTEWSLERVEALIDEQIPENHHLEYKEQAPDKSGKTEKFSEDFLETIVAMSNGDGGIIIYGVSDGGNALPGAITGVVPRGDLEAALRNKCDTMIQPKVTVDTKILDIPQPSTAGADKLMLVRIPPGTNPPYSIHGTRVFLRVGPDDRPPSVRDLESLFKRRVDLTPSVVSHWDTAIRDTFAFNLSDPEKPVALMVAVTPTFPIDPREVGREEDLAFVDLARSLFRPSAHDFQMLPQGVAFNPINAQDGTDAFAYMCAYGDGTVACRTGLKSTHSTDGGRRLDIIALWLRLRQILRACRAWPRDVCRASGPVSVKVKLAHLEDTVLTLPEHLVGESRNQIFVPTEGPHARRNNLPYWEASGIWEGEEELQGLIERVLMGLARVLQCEAFHDKVLLIRDLTSRASS